MLFQEVFSGVMSPIIRELQNKLHCVLLCQSSRLLMGPPGWGGRRDSALAQGTASQEFKLEQALSVPLKIVSDTQRQWSSFPWITYFHGFVFKRCCISGRETGSSLTMCRVVWDFLPIWTLLATQKSLLWCASTAEHWCVPQHHWISRGAYQQPARLQSASTHPSWVSLPERAVTPIYASP